MPILLSVQGSRILAKQFGMTNSTSCPASTQRAGIALMKVVKKRMETVILDYRSSCSIGHSWGPGWGSLEVGLCDALCICLWLLGGPTWSLPERNTKHGKQFSAHSQISWLYLFVCLFITHSHTLAQVWKHSLWRSVLFYHHVGPWDPIQVIRPNGKCLCSPKP